MLVFNLDNINYKCSDVPDHLDDEKIETLIQTYGDEIARFANF